MDEKLLTVLDDLIEVLLEATTDEDYRKPFDKADTERLEKLQRRVIEMKTAGEETTAAANERKVWVVMAGEKREGGRVVGLHSNAQSALRRLSKIRDSDYFHPEVDWVVVQEWDVED